uniref:Protein tweety homolog n=1 Tax=Glossina morsitans morsitans TaxID=37546 RepID=A0A1B0FJ12_GLOMM
MIGKQLITEAIKHDLERKMSQHRLEAQIERVQYNQTAVMLLIETCNLVRENTSRAVTSLDNMVLYFMKTKGSENDDDTLMGLLQMGELYESIRWPATLGFLTLLLLLCTVLVIGVARRSRCALIFFSVSGLFCIIMCWLLSGIYLASSVAAGDFCMRPHEYMCRQVGMRSPYVYFLNCGTLRNRFILRLNESRDLVERARESVYLIQRMSQETYPRIDVHKTLEAMDNDLEETKRNLTVLSATLDRRAIDRHYADALRGLCGGGLLGLSLMMVAGLLTSFLFTILVYADSHAWIYLNKRRPSMDIDKSETVPLFPSNAPSANISPTAPLHHTGTINRTLLHHQQLHGGMTTGSTGTLGSSRSNGTANGLRTGFVATYNNPLHHQQQHHHKTNTSLGSTAISSRTGGAGVSSAVNNRRLSPSPPPGYDVVVHGIRHGFFWPSYPGPFTISSAAILIISKRSITSNGIGRNSLKSIFTSATLPRSAGSSLRSVLSSQTSNTMYRSTGNGLDRDDDKDPRDVTNNSFNRFDPKYISIGPKAVRGNNNLNVVAAATASKCATLRHVGRYGGSLKGTSPSANLRNAKTPSIATVSKDYCSQPDCITQAYPSNPTDAQQQQKPPPPLDPPIPLPPKTPSATPRPLPPPTQIQTLQSAPPRSLNPNSIVNQPLPEIPNPATLQQQHQQSKISPQPLCAANLNQYRSLQRPQAQKLQLSAANAAVHTATQSTNLNQQTTNQLQPPTLPPKNRHKTSPRQHNAGSGEQHQQIPQVPPPKVSNLRHQQQSYERERERERDRERERERERERDRHERPRRSETLDNARSNLGYGEQQSAHLNIRKQYSYDSGQPNSYFHQRHSSSQAATTPNNNYHHSTSATAKQHQQQQQQLLVDAQQQMYYRSLKRGGSHGNNDMYSECACCGGGVDVVRRSACHTTSGTSAVAMAGSNHSTVVTSTAPIPLPPKKHRSSSRSRDSQETSIPAVVCNANTCIDHEYDEYCPGAYESQQSGIQRQSHSAVTATKHHQRAATFDVADAREYELRRLGNRRSQSQVANLKYRNGGLNVIDHHRGERTHDRERSRSDHRIGSYTYDDTIINGAMTHAFSSSITNGGINHHQTSHHLNQSSDIPQQPPLQQPHQQQRQQQRHYAKTIPIVAVVRTLSSNYLCKN